jgi:hypothetical protein
MIEVFLTETTRLVPGIDQSEILIKEVLSFG